MLKASAAAARMTTTEKTGARPYCNGSSPFAVNSKEDEARPSRNGSSSSELTPEVFSGVGGSGRRRVSPSTPGSDVRGGGGELLLGSMASERFGSSTGGWGLGVARGTPSSKGAPPGRAKV